MAMPISAACKPRAVRDVIISESSIVFGRRKAAWVYPRGLYDHAGINRREKRRSDQSSRRMLGRRMAQTVRPEVILQRRNLAGNCKRRTECCGRRASQELAHAGRHQHAFVAVDRRGGL